MATTNFNLYIMNNDWLKFKKYPNIGLPLTGKDDEWIRRYVTNESNIKKHKFSPLIHRKIVQRRYRPIAYALKNDSGKRQRTVLEKKTRHIYYPTHIDSIIFSYYNQSISNKYEEYLSDKPYSTAVVAYRKIPIEGIEYKNKSNIEFAFEAFKFIDTNKNKKLSVIVADVTSFFDNLNHRILHKNWKRILGLDSLPDDHYKVYKNLINYSYVDEVDLFHRFKNDLIVKRYIPNNSTVTELKNKKVKKMYNMRRENVVAYCTIKNFYKFGSDMIRHNKPYNAFTRIALEKSVKKGIPQGTPLSATLANIYMLDFDEHIFTEADSRNAFYQRYSDDIIIVCDQNDETYFSKLIKDEIENQVKLEIQSSKTNIYRYELNQDNILAGGIVVNNIVTTNKQLEYLGFNYDGSKVRVKACGFSKFYRSMKKAFRRGAHFAKATHIPSNSLFESKLYNRYTHYGSKRRLLWVKDLTSPTGYKKSTQQHWGNYISYLNKANEVMKPINQNDSISRQHRKFWNKFHEIKQKTYRSINSLNSM